MVSKHIEHSQPKIQQFLFDYNTCCDCLAFLSCSELKHMAMKWSGSSLCLTQFQFHLDFSDPEHCCFPVWQICPLHTVPESVQPKYHKFSDQILIQMGVVLDSVSHPDLQHLFSVGCGCFTCLENPLLHLLHNYLM